MPNDDISKSRRRFLKGGLVTLPAAGLFGASELLKASEPVAPYQPTFFTEPEWRFIQAAVDRLIPSSEEGPGALELDVPRFIDRQMQDTYGSGGYWYMQGPFVPSAPPTLGYQLRFAPRDIYRMGSASVDRWCTNKHRHVFAELSVEARDDVLRQLQQGEINLGDIPSSAFFSQLLTNTREGYFADPIHGGNRGMGSWKMIGFPGARADFMDWADQQGKRYPLGPVSISGEEG
jgi:gluconate 2-dehydrogenase gamma chain